MLLNKAAMGGLATPSNAPKTESAAFKNLKEQLNKPKPASLGMFGTLTGGKKSTGPSFMDQKKGHHHASGGFNKSTGVPRRTNG